MESLQELCWRRVEGEREKATPPPGTGAIQRTWRREMESLTAVKVAVKSWEYKEDFATSILLVNFDTIGYKYGYKMSGGKRNNNLTFGWEDTKLLQSL